MKTSAGADYGKAGETFVLGRTIFLSLSVESLWFQGYGKSQFAYIIHKESWRTVWVFLP
jgi:hypothetical protein